ncbi:MAG: type IV pilus secretin PilQ [Desulfobacteraceae bacterium]|jgi:type IV pilus assembly protein PilQ|nr:MAG: type IV pilus secretin PilQ [Desulfobacteraceae bacterium]
MVERRNAVTGKRIGRAILAVGVLLCFLCAGCASKTRPPETADIPAGVAIAQKQITGIKVDGPRITGEADRVVIQAGSELDFTAIRQYDPPGIVLYFPETTVGDVMPRYTPESNAVASVTTAVSPDQTGARVEIALKQDMTYEVLRSGNDIEISLVPEIIPPSEISAAGHTVQSASTGPDIAASDIKDPAGDDAYMSSAKTSLLQTATSAAPAVVNRIDFSSREAGRSAVIIGTTTPVRYEIMGFSDQALRLRLFHARLPEHRQHRPLITTRFESAIDRISPIAATGMADATDIVIELREWVPYRPVQEDDVITIHFDPSNISPRTVEAAALPDWQAALAETSRVYTDTGTAASPAAQPRPGFAPEPAASGPQMLSAFEPQQHYTGQKIALDFHKTDIKNVFRILQQVSGKNYAVDRDVTGEVTIALEKPVPWDQVLELILKMNQLGSVEDGDIIRIARTATLQAEEKARRDQMEAERLRQEQEVKLEPLETAYLTVNYATAETEIAPHLKDIITKDRGTLTIDKRNNQLIITDTRFVINQARKIIAEIDKVTPQVLIEARIVEVTENFNRELGMSWGVGGEDIYRSDLGGQYSYNVAMNTPFKSDPGGTSSGTIGMNFTRLNAWGTPIVLDAALRAMEEQGKVKIVSTPKVLTLNNKAATIEQGSRVPYQELSEQGVPTTEYADAMLSLNVTPQITPDDRIALKVVTTKDEVLDFIPPTNAPRLSINRAETELLVDDGETIVIGGVIKTELVETETGFPVLKDIPMLGWLFKSTETNSSKKELMIFITPRIVQLEQKSLVQAD